MSQKEINIEESWKSVLKEEFGKKYFRELKAFLIREKREKQLIYPPGPLIFNAFNITPFDKVKVVILGQDPYHGAGQAMGLSFSVPHNVLPPPSLKNIFKEIHLDLGLTTPSHGDLTSWAEQGVFLLNAVLTVRHKSPGSHKNAGWHQFTDAVIQALSDQRDGLIFLLWGNFAKSKKPLIDELKHFVFESVHPSPFTGNAFFGNHHFSKTNEVLKKQGKEEIDWSLPNFTDE